MAIKQLRICDLVEDMEIYPRHAVDDAHVASLSRALESGETFPPIVADRKSKRIVDGWHRVRAYKRIVGPEAVIDVDLRSYANEGTLLLDAVSLNSSHGRRLDVIDQARVVVMLERAGVEQDKIAVSLHVPEAHVIKLKVRLATATHESTGTIPGTKQVSLKRPVSWMAGQKLTDEQVETHAMLPGTSFLLIARQLTKALRSKMCNFGDEKLLAGLKDLRTALMEALG